MDSFARGQAVVEAHPVLVFRVLAPRYDVHVPSKVGSFVHSPGASFHFNGVAAIQVHVEIGAVAITVIVAALKIFVFVESNLKYRANKEVGGVGWLC